MSHSGNVAVILVLALAGCNRDQKPPAAAQRPVVHAPAPADSMRLITLPPQKLDTVSVEGTPQQMTLRLLQPASSMPFYTYMPADMIAVDSSTAKGEAHYFIANFGGRRNNNAYLLLYIFPAGMSKEDVVAAAKAYRDSHQDSALSAAFDLRMHNDRYYFIAQQYPKEYAEGFGPRAARILKEWQWLDVTSVPRP